MAKNVVEILISAKDQASRTLQGVSSQTAQLHKDLLKTSAGMFAVGAAITGAYVKAATATAAYGDELGKTSKRINVSVEDLGRMRFAAQQSGAQFQDLVTGYRFLAKAASDANAGLSTQVRAFARLGIDVRDANGQLKDTQALFLEVADAIAVAEDQTQAIATAQELLGRGALTLRPLLLGGAAGIKELSDEADRLGIVMSEADARISEEFVDTQNRLKQTLRSVRDEIGMAVIPTMDRFINDTLVPGARAVKDFISAHEGIVELTARLAALAMAIGAVGTAALSLKFTVPRAFAALGGAPGLATAGAITGGALAGADIKRNLQANLFTGTLPADLQRIPGTTPIPFGAQAGMTIEEVQNLRIEARRADLLGSGPITIEGAAQAILAEQAKPSKVRLPTPTRSFLQQFGYEDIPPIEITRMGATGAPEKVMAPGIREFLPPATLQPEPAPPPTVKASLLLGKEGEGPAEKLGEALTNSAKYLETFGDKVDRVAGRLGDELAYEIGSAAGMFARLTWDGLATANTLREVGGTALKNFGHMLTRLAATRLAEKGGSWLWKGLKVVGGAALGFVLGGPAGAAGGANVANKMQSGGIVPMTGGGGIDTVPAMLTPGESVLPVAVTQALRSILGVSGGTRASGGDTPGSRLGPDTIQLSFPNVVDLSNMMAQTVASQVKPNLDDVGVAGYAVQS